ncbi:hypothetical protein EKG40_03545 [Pseudomonas moorei]|nr:hypothetical protein EKG40_03545 [Pseudomonas moorei]
MPKTIRHPTFDFISITQLTFDEVIQAAFSRESENEPFVAEALEPTRTDNAPPTETVESETGTTWFYSIDEVTGRGSFPTQQEAILAAEEGLFGEYKEWADEYLLQAIAANDLQTALALVERRGFHEGQAYARHQTAKLIKHVWTQIEPLSRC